MLIPATMEDLAKYSDFFYELALDPKTSSYPTYADGIKTKEDFIADAQKGITSPNRELLLFSQNGMIEGWLQYFRIPEDRYLQLCSCNIRVGTEQALSELMEHLQKRFLGDTLYFGFPADNTEARHFLTKNGFSCIEQSWNHTLPFDQYVPHTVNGTVAPINRDNYNDFRTVYIPDENTYWNCERIFEQLDTWIIFVYYQEDRPLGTIFLQGDTGDYEIFELSYLGRDDPTSIYRALLVSALNHCKDLSAKHMTFFCEEDHLQILSELGFRCIGQYVCYIKSI